MTDVNRRREYERAQLDESELDADPFAQFRFWLDAASEDESVDEALAMTVATSTPDGVPSARIVLLRGIDDSGLRFFTNYESEKGQELLANPKAALVFHWPSMERQIRITGDVARLGEAESDEYFASRPHKSRLSALVSEQSRVVDSRASLEQKMRTLLDEYPEGDHVPRPSNWGGFRVSPRTFEFWQGRRSRMHDRIHYRRNENGAWVMERLSP